MVRIFCYQATTISYWDINNLVFPIKITALMSPYNKEPHTLPAKESKLSGEDNKFIKRTSSKECKCQGN